MIYRFKCPIFGVSVILVTGDKKQLNKVAKLSGDECEYHDAECSTLLDDDDIVKGFLVWILVPDDYYAMVHETMHLVKRIFKVIGIPFNSDNDEVMAYYQNYWVRKFWNKMSKGLK